MPEPDAENKKIIAWGALASGDPRTFFYAPEELRDPPRGARNLPRVRAKNLFHLCGAQCECVLRGHEGGGQSLVLFLQAFGLAVLQEEKRLGGIVRIGRYARQLELLPLRVRKFVGNSFESDDELVRSLPSGVKPLHAKRKETEHEQRLDDFEETARRERVRMHFDILTVPERPQGTLVPILIRIVPNKGGLVVAPGPDGPRVDERGVMAMVYDLLGRRTRQSVQVRVD